MRLEGRLRGKVSQKGQDVGSGMQDFVSGRNACVLSLYNAEDVGEDERIGSGW